MQRCKGHTIAHLGVIIRQASLRECVLSVNDFQCGRFAGLITKFGKAQTFGGIAGSLFAGGERSACDRGFVISRVKTCELFALRLAELGARLRLCDLGLMKFAAERTPIENGNIDAGGDEVAEIREWAEIGKLDVDAAKGELVGFDAVVGFDIE